MRGIMRKSDVIEVTEYEAIVYKGPGRRIDKEMFEELEELMLTLSDEGRDGLDFLKLSSRKGSGRVIQVRNYVGVLQMPSGRQLQILPKIHTTTVDAKTAMLKMLRTMRDFPSKSFDATALGNSRMSMFEVYIKLFLDEVSLLVRRGLKSDYRRIEENVRFYKGKMNFARQLTVNHVHKERFFVTFDEYGIDCPENRILKKALMKTLGSSTDAKNRKDARRLLDHFDGIAESHAVAKDFAGIIDDRKNGHYQKAIGWARLLLNDLNVSNTTGTTDTQSLLFSMDQLFESYVGHVIQHRLGREWDISLKGPVKHLFDNGSFRLMPDVVARYRDASDGRMRTRVIDMKWKILDPRSTNLGISSSDMYQMFAYAKKYSCEHVVVVYPLVEGLSRRNIQYTDGDITVHIHLFDCVDGEEDLIDLLRSLDSRQPSVSNTPIIPTKK